MKKDKNSKTEKKGMKGGKQRGMERDLFFTASHN